MQGKVSGWFLRFDLPEISSTKSQQKPLQRCVEGPRSQAPDTLMRDSAWSFVLKWAAVGVNHERIGVAGVEFRSIQRVVGSN